MGFGTVRGKGKVLKSLFLRPLQNFEVRLFSVPIVLLLGGIGCLSLVSSIPLLVILSVISIFVALVSFFHGWGYGISVIGAISLGLTLCSNFSVSVFWAGLLTLTFIVSYGVLLLGISLVEGLIEEKTVSLTKEATFRNELQDSYNREVQKHKEKEYLFQEQVSALESELSVCHAQFREVTRKYELTTKDLQVLIDQRDSWIEDYTALHQEYVRIIAGDREETFPFQEAIEEGCEEEALDRKLLQENEVVCLEKIGEEKLYVKESLEKALLDLLESARHREVLERESARKDSEIESLKQELAAEKLFSSSVNQEIAAYKGKYLQLREQFNTKDIFLKKARRERFLAQEQLLTLKRKKEEEASDLKMDSFFIIQNLLLQIEALEEEVTCLEELVLRTQNQ